MQLLKNELQNIHPVSDDIIDEYLSHWKEASFKRKEFVTREGEVERYLSFVIEGIQKSYFLKDDKEHIVAFAHPGSFSGSPRSLYGQLPSEVFIECITPCRLIRIDYRQHLEMLQKYRELETLFRKSAEWLLVGLIERYNELMALSIEERFKSFITRSPKLLNLIPHKDLSSYLRIDASNFSKLLNSVKVG